MSKRGPARKEPRPQQDEELDEHWSQLAAQFPLDAQVQVYTKYTAFIKAYLKARQAMEMNLASDEEEDHDLSKSRIGIWKEDSQTNQHSWDLQQD